MNYIAFSIIRYEYDSLRRQRQSFRLFAWNNPSRWMSCVAGWNIFAEGKRPPTEERNVEGTWYVKKLGASCVAFFVPFESVNKSQIFLVFPAFVPRQGRQVLPYGFETGGLGSTAWSFITASRCMFQLLAGSVSRRLWAKEVTLRETKGSLLLLLVIIVIFGMPSISFHFPSATNVSNVGNQLDSQQPCLSHQTSSPHFRKQLYTR